MPVKMPTVAGQLSGWMPSGAKAGVTALPITLSTERSLFSLPNEPSVPTEFKMLSTITIATMSLPARQMNTLRRSQVRREHSPECGQVVGRPSP